MKKIIRLSENDLKKLIKKIVKEADPGDGLPDDFSDVVMLDKDQQKETDPDFEQNLAEIRNRKKLHEQDLATMIKGLKSCYAKASQVSTNGKKYEYIFPGSCEKGFHEDCIKKVMVDLSKFAGNHMKNSSFQNCVNKLSPEIKKRTSSWG